MLQQLLKGTILAAALGLAGFAPAGAGTLGDSEDFDLAAASHQGGQASEKKPKKNVEIVRSLYTAFAAGDLDTILAIIHPDVVWTESDGIPYGGTFIGRDAVFEGVFGKIGAEWDGFTAVPEEFLDAGDQVVVLGRDSGTFKATGKSMVAPAASVFTLNEDGQVVRFVQYIDTLAVHSATIP